MKVTLTIEASEEHGWTPEQLVEHINEAEGLLVKPLEASRGLLIVVSEESLNEAAKALQKLQGDAIWERTSEEIRRRYRKRVKALGAILGIHLEEL